MGEKFKLGEKVVWFKQVPGGAYVYPVIGKVLGVTEKRIKIEAEDEDGIVIRYVKPESLQKHK